MQKVMDDHILVTHPDNVAIFALENIRKYQKMHNYSFLRSILLLCTDINIRHTVGKYLLDTLRLTCFDGWDDVRQSSSRVFQYVRESKCVD